MKAILEFFRHMFAPTLTSQQFELNARDWAKGFFLAVLAPPLTIIWNTVQSSLAAGQFTFTFDWKVVAGSFGTAFGTYAAYMIKNYFTGTNPPPNPTESKKNEIASKPPVQ